eukprot:1138686-Pelagomonas_calceolata.AAC.2
MMRKVISFCSFQSGKRFGISAEFEFSKINIPVLRRDLSRMKVGRSAWDRAHKGSIRAALVLDRANNIGEKLKLSLLQIMRHYVKR